MPAARIPSTLTVPALLAARAGTQPDRAALVTPAGQELPFGRWQRRSAAIAGGLVERGVRPGDRVVLRFGNQDWIDFAACYVGVQRAGAVAVPVSDRLSADQTGFVVRDCGAVAVLHAATGPAGAATGPASAATGPASAAAGPASGGGGAWLAHPADLEDGRDADVAVGPGDIAQILYTSGTTGRPKGVAASHANLTYGCTTGARRLRLAHSEEFLHAFPIGTNAGQTMLLNALDAHPAALAMPRFTPGRFAKLVEQRRVGTAFVVPAMAIELLQARAHERYDLTSLRLLGSTGAALPPAVATALAAALPTTTIVNYYTSTEAAPAQTTMLFDPARPASVGRPSAGSTLRIAGEDGAALPAGTVGEVWLRSPTATRAYYGDTGSDGGVFDRGWVRMGDLGYLDADGYLYLVDRESDVVKSGGHKISTLQVEAALHEHPDVVEAAAFGVPHPVLGSAVAAAVVGRGEIPAATLRAFLITRLAAHELPARLINVDRLPRNDAGKVLKRELRALLDQRAEDGG
ncbi:MAG TPA: class I adenylate-forming enzyme family protein [Pilimelia sp.]|nr:class I adenylate-forming enzyme family protein [Pilimelia sp.]